MMATRATRRARLRGVKGARVSTVGGQGGCCGGWSRRSGGERETRESRERDGAEERRCHLSSAEVALGVKGVPEGVRGSGESSGQLEWKRRRGGRARE